MNKSEKVRELVEKNPTLSKKALGQMAFKLGLANNPESGRKMVGMATTWSHSDIKKTDKYIGPKLNTGRVNNYDPFILNSSRIAILSDIHIPYHNIESLTCAFDFAKSEKPDAILLNGDTLDFFGLSRFSKDPKARSFAHELKTFKEFMDVLKKTFDAKIYFKIGNHEERYFHFLWMKAHEIVGVEEFELENIIKSRAEGIEIIKDKRIIKAGDLNIIHGHEFGGSVFSPVNVARGLFLRGKVSAMQGHNHQSSVHVERDMNGGVVKTWSLGCLCELHPAYLPINKWNHGFSIVDIDKQDFSVRNYTIDKGVIS